MTLPTGLLWTQKSPRDSNNKDRNLHGFCALNSGHRNPGPNHYSDVMKSLYPIFLFAVAFCECIEQEPTTNPPQKSQLRALQTIGQGWTYQEEYRYHSDGRVEEIRWERNTPFTTQGVETYQYDNNLQLSGMVKEMTGLVTEEIRYRYSGSQIVEASSYSNGVKESYTLYSYNPTGQLVKTQFFKRNPISSEMLADGETRFLYHPDGNVQEIQEFVYDRQQSQMKLHTTRTFPEYLLNREAVLDAYPTIPKVRLQKNLPTKYVLMTPSTQMEVKFDYRWMPDGILLDRTAIYPDGTSEQTVFTFFP